MTGVKPPRVGGPWCWGNLVTVGSPRWALSSKGKREDCAAWCWPSSRAEARVAFRGPMRRGPRARKEPRLPCADSESAGEGGRRARAAPLATPQTRESGAGAGRRGMNNRGTRQLTRNLEGESDGGRDG